MTIEQIKQFFQPDWTKGAGVGLILGIIASVFMVIKRYNLDNQSTKTIFRFTGGVHSINSGVETADIMGVLMEYLPVVLFFILLGVSVVYLIRGTVYWKRFASFFFIASSIISVGFLFVISKSQPTPYAVPLFVAIIFLSLLAIPVATIIGAIIGYVIQKSQK